MDNRYIDNPYISHFMYIQLILYILEIYYIKKIGSQGMEAETSQDL